MPFPTHSLLGSNHQLLKCRAKGHPGLTGRWPFSVTAGLPLCPRWFIFWLHIESSHRSACAPGPALALTACTTVVLVPEPSCSPWSQDVLPRKCPFSLFIKHILGTSLNIVPIASFYNRNRRLIPKCYFQTNIIFPLFYCKVCCFLILRERTCNASQNTSLCSKEKEGVTNHSSNSKLINTSLYPTFKERLPVGGKINGQFNTYSSFFKEKLYSLGYWKSLFIARF